MKIEVHGTEEECQAALDAINGAIGGRLEVVVEVNIENPPAAAKPFVLIQGGRSTRTVSKKVELPQLS